MSSQSKPIKINKNIHTVMEFTDMIHMYHGANKKTADQGKFSWSNEQETVLFHYALLGDDAVVWNQEISIEHDQDISMVAIPNDQQTFTFTYFFESSTELYIDSGLILTRKV